VEAKLGLTGQVGENHGDQITSMTGAVTRDYHAGAIKSFGVTRSLQGNGHLCPNGNRLPGSKFDSVFPKSEATGWQIDARGWRLNGNRMEQMRTVDFASAHTKNITIIKRNVNLWRGQVFKIILTFFGQKPCIRVNVAALKKRGKIARFLFRQNFQIS